MHGYLSLDIICSSKLTVLLELRSRKTVRFLEQIMSADKYPCIFSRQMETIAYVFENIDLRQTIRRVFRGLHFRDTQGSEFFWGLRSEFLRHPPFKLLGRERHCKSKVL